MQRTKRGASQVTETKVPPKAPASSQQKKGTKEIVDQKEPAPAKGPGKSGKVTPKSHEEEVEAAPEPRGTRGRQAEGAKRAGESQNQMEKRPATKRKAPIEEREEGEEEEEEDQGDEASAAAAAEERPAKRARKDPVPAKEKDRKAVPPPAKTKDSKNEPAKGGRTKTAETAVEEQPARKTRSSAETSSNNSAPPAADTPREKKTQRKIVDEDSEDERPIHRVTGDKGKRRADSESEHDFSFQLSKLPDVSFEMSPIPRGSLTPTTMRSPRPLTLATSKSPMQSPAGRRVGPPTTAAVAARDSPKNLNRSADSSASLDSSLESVKSKSETLFADVHFEADKKRVVKRKIIREDKVLASSSASSPFAPLSFFSFLFLQAAAKSAMQDQRKLFAEIDKFKLLEEVDE